VKYVIAGAGAIGTYIGAHLARAGLDVTLFGRGPHLRAMLERPVRVETPDDVFEMRLQATDDLASVPQADVVILGVKAHSLPELAPRLKPLFGSQTVVVSLQNGVPWWYFQDHAGPLAGLRLERLDPGGQISAAIELKRIIGAVLYMPTEIVEPGVVRRYADARILLGEPDGSPSERAQAITQDLINSGLCCEIAQSIREDIWIKIMVNLAFSPISVLTRAPIGTMLADCDVRRLARDIMSEIEALSKQLGLNLSTSIDQRIARAEKLGDFKPSMLQDLEAGRPLEIEAIAGVPLEIADLLGCTMTNTRAIYACVKLVASQQLQG
jgi:2-dehydropantoate 2-reductase